jgi:predicted small secreted protein
MKKAYFLTAAAALVAVLAVAPLLARQNTAAGIGADMFDIICSSLPVAVTSRLGLASTGEGESEAGHDSATGLYMPMFSTPPKGGTVYNGPPLDDC